MICVFERLRVLRMLRGAVCCLPVLLSVLSTSVEADVVQTIYDASATSNVGANTANIGGGNPSITDNMNGTLTLSSDPTAGNNNAFFLDSGDGGSIATLLGRSLIATDTVTVRGTIDSVTGISNFSGNGIEFGLQSATGFRSDPNLLFQIDDGTNRGGEAPFFGTNGNVNATSAPAVNEAGLRDGFSFEAIYDVNGITFNVTDVVTFNIQPGDVSTPTSYSYFVPAGFLGYDFLTDVNGSFAYLSVQRTGTGQTDVNLSEFTIEVESVAVPEPTSATLLTVGGLGMLMRRRRRS